MLYPFTHAGKTGWLDASGRVVLKTKYDAGGSFSGGVAQISVGNERAFIDERGRELFRVPVSTHFEPFGPEGLAYFSRWDVEAGRQRASFRDKRGKERELDLDDASSPHEGLAAARRDRGSETTWIGTSAAPSPYDPSTAPWGYVDHRGGFVIEERYAHARPFQEERAAVAERVRGRLRWSYIDKNGGTLNSKRYDGATDFLDGLASIGENDAAILRPKSGRWDSRFALAWGLIDSEGRRVLPSKWRAPIVFNDEVAAACERPLEWSIIDRKGRSVSAARFSELHPFRHGVAPARDPRTERWGLVAADASWVLAPRFEGMQAFAGELAHFTLRSSRTRGKSRYGYVDARGNVIIEFTG